MRVDPADGYVGCVGDLTPLGPVGFENSGRWLIAGPGWLLG
jgi:hypothetical protein